MPELSGYRNAMKFRHEQQRNAAFSICSNVLHGSVLNATATGNSSFSTGAQR
jgi:hypothetical protein